MSTPVFYDPEHRRWLRFRQIAHLSAVALSVLFCALLMSVLVNPPLPTLALISTQRTAVPPVAHQTGAASTLTPTATPAALPRPTPTSLPSAPSRPLPQARSHNAPATHPTLDPARQPFLARIQKRLQGTPVPPLPKISPAAAATVRAQAQREVRAYIEAQRTAAARAPVNPQRAHATPTRTLPARVAPTAQPQPQTQRQTPKLTPTIKPGTTTQPELTAFYVNWDDTSFASLEQNVTRIDRLVPEWLHLDAKAGTIAVDDVNRQALVVDYLKRNRPALPIVPLINNYDDGTQDWDSQRLAQMLGNASSRAKVIQALLDYVRANNFQGVSIDFENLPSSNTNNLTQFMRDLYAQFHPLGLEVSESVPVDDDAFDYKALAPAVDYLILMMYDEHWSGQDAGPVASQPWFADALRRRFAEVSPDKYVIALGNYGYDWSSDQTGDELSFQAAVRTAELVNAPIRFDADALNPTFDFTDENDVQHHVWYLDGVSLFNQIVEAERFKPRGLALWRLGSEDPSAWSAFDQRTHLDGTAADSLRELRYGYDLDYEGKGEVIKLMAGPHDGSRTVTFDAGSGLITSEQLTVYPSPYVIMRWGGGDPKQIALTFDDGPSPGYTAAILDVLKRYNVRATFFVIGSNAQTNAPLLKRMLDEGHEIGNHTFTHPDVSAITPEQLGFELNATDRLFESQLGRHSLLFRPPYGEDVEPERPDQLLPLLLTGDLGYYTVGMHVDPNDWRNPGTNQIVQTTLDQVAGKNGNIVLLHDGGGDRSQTLAALPRIIEGLQAKGYELVSVSDLLGLTRDEVMPPISQQEQVIARVNDAGFSLLSALSWAVNSVFLAGIALGVLRVAFIGLLAVVDAAAGARRPYDRSAQPRVAVIVPAFNEEKVICQTIDALLKSSYPDLEIIVVDDGSSDGTFGRASETYAQEQRVRVFTRANGGKAAALNFGIHQTCAPLIVAQDADTIILPEAIGKLVRHFADPRVGAVAGNAKVGNRVNLLTEWQALEYITSQNLDRRAFAALNCITVVPGAIGAWRRELLVSAGEFQSDTLAEDAALTMKILRLGYRIHYEADAIGLTEAPDNVRGFLKQRFRWMFGTLQAAWQNRDTLFRPPYGALGMVALPNIFVFQIFFPFISPVMDLLAVSSLLGVLLQHFQHPLDSQADGLLRIIFFYALFQGVDFLAALLAFILERREDWSLLVWVFVQRFCYRQLIYFAAIKSALAAIRGSVVGWGHVERKATVRSSGTP
jgi:cellulose synthase/poly-beta-1,6-N-acetylglucosamine synthase-like glycosyltransferase/peptidoglycan/xylan/chitin deacetylase (PgdA/CDA1 family)/spore germination protein YaaH